MTGRLSRRHLAQLLALVLIGGLVGLVLQRTRPIGQNVSGYQTAEAVLLDRRSPSREVRVPTLTLAVFTDYQCPACKIAHPALEAAVAADGHVRVVYKDLPILGPLSEQAARVAIASDRQSIYPAVHGRLMAERRRLNEAVLREAIERAGGDWSLLQRDLKIHAADIDRQLDRNRGHAFGLGIAGTPAYLAGPILIRGAIDQTEFARAFALGREAAR